MNELQKLYDVLSREGYYTKSFDEFKTKWNDGAYRKKVYDVVSRDGLYTKTEDDFYAKYSGGSTRQQPKVEAVEQQQPVKKKEPTVSASKLGQPTSASSSKRRFEGVTEQPISQKKVRTDDYIDQVQNAKTKPKQTKTVVANTFVPNATEQKVDVITTDEANKMMAEDFGKKEFDLYSKISEIDKNILNSGESNAVEYLNDKFKGSGFIFEETGFGTNEVRVKSTLNDGFGTVVNEKIIKLPTTVYTGMGLAKTTTPEKSQKEIADFMNQSFLKKSEKEFLSEDVKDYGQLVKLAVNNPQKYGEGFLNEYDSERWLDKQYRDLVIEGKSIKREEQTLQSEIDAYQKSGVRNEETERLLKSRQANLQNQVAANTTKYEELKDISTKLPKAAAVYFQNKEKQGNTLGMITRSLSSGLMNMEKALITTAADVAPLLIPSEYMIPEVQQVRLKASGMSESDIKDYASKQLRKGVVDEALKGAKDLYSLGTTDAYIQSEDRNDLEKTASFLAESIGTALSAGGNPLLTKLAFFSQSYNAIEDEMNSPEFDSMSQMEKKIMSVPYGIAIGALDRLGFKISTGVSKNPLLNKLVTNTIANAFTSIPKNASVEVMQQAISQSLKATMAKTGLEIVGGALVEGATEGAQSLAEYGMKNLYNNFVADKDVFQGVPDITTKEGFEKALGAAKEEAYYGTLGGLIMASGSTALQSISKGFDKGAEEFDFFSSVIDDPNLRALIESDIKTKITSGELTKAEAYEQIAAINKSVSILNQMPSKMSSDKKMEAYNLILEKNKIDKDINGKDPSLVKPQKARIAEINSRLEQIGEENAVQEQATGEVPVQSEAGVSQEMAQRAPETTTEQVTEEGDQAVDQEEITATEEQAPATQNTFAPAAIRNGRAEYDANNLPFELGNVEPVGRTQVGRGRNKKVTLQFSTEQMNEAGLGWVMQQDGRVEDAQVVQETVQPDVQEAPVVEEVEVEEIAPEVQQELDEFETILADEGFAFEEEVAPEVDVETEDVVVPAPPSRRGRGVSSKTPTQAAAATPAAQPAPAKKKTKKQLVNEAKERFIADIDEKVKREKTVRDVKLAELANKRTRAINQGNREESQRLFLEMDEIKSVSKRKIDELEAKKANPSAFARFRKRSEEGELADKRNSAAKIAKEMNQMNAEEQEFEEPTVSGEAEINPAEDSKQPEGVISKVLKFLGLKSKDQLLRKIEDFDGIPMIMAMSDILSSGEIKDAMGNVMVVDGGLGFNTFGRNMELAWAGVTKDGAQKQYDEAVALYEANKELFDRLWAEGKIPKGHIPMAVMRMGNTAVNSNEAVFRYVLPYIQSLPLENRKAALNSLLEGLRSKAEGNAASIWYTELSEQLDNGEIDTIEGVKKYLEDIINNESTGEGKRKAATSFLNSISKKKEGRERTLEDVVEQVNEKVEKIVPFMLSNYIKENNIDTLDGLFEVIVEQSKKRAEGETNIFSLPIRAYLYKAFFSNEGIKTNTLKPIQALLKGVEGGRNELFTSDYLYQQIGDPSMMKTKMGDVVGVMGIDVLNGGVTKSTHNNYGYGPKGRLISFISNPKQGVDVFPEFRAKAARVFKKDKKGNYPNADAVAGQTGGAFFMDSAFRGAKPKFGKITDLDMLVGKLRFAFPEVSVSNTTKEWNTFMNQEGVRTREKDGDIIYGVTKDGRIFLNPNFDSLRTPIHEFGHIWIDYLRSKESAKKGKMLLAKGLELVDGTPEYKRALKEYGDRDIALEEALVELLAVKGDTIINAAKRSKFKSWMNAMFKYIKENLVRSKKIANDKIKDLTLDEFINIGLADLFSGERVSGKFDARTAEGAAKARKSKQNVVNNIVEIGRAKGISDAAIKEALKKRGYTAAQINEALTAQPEATQAPVDALNEFLDSINTVVKEYAAAARKKVRADMKTKRAVLAAKLKAMQTKGSITAKQAQALLEKVNKLNLSNSVAVDRFLHFAENVFNNAEYVDSISTINKLLPAAKRNIKSKLGVANDLVPLLQSMLAVKPTFVPMSVFDTYKSIIETIGQRQTELTLPEISELVKQVQEVNEAIDVESGLAVDLMERLENYPDKIEENGKLQYTETINKMLEDGIINDYEMLVMKKYRSMIAPTERTKKTEQELEQERNDMIDSLKNETVDASTLPSRDERNLANKLAAFIKTDVLNFLTAQELRDLQKIADNINNGFITNRAQILVEKMDGIVKRNNLISPIQRVKVMLGERLKSGAKKALFRKKGNFYKYILEGNSSAFIDEVFGNFRERPFYENIFKPLAEALASFSAENRVVSDRITKMEQSLAKAFGRNQNKMTMSKFKMMTWLIQNEFESNPNSRQVNPAIEFLKKTIKETNAERTYYSQDDVKMFEEIVNKYQDVMKDENGDPILDKDGKEVMGIDMNKLFESFNPTEKKILSEIRTINDMMSEKAEYTAAIIRGSRITPIANYISLGVINGDTRADQLDSINELRNVFGNSRTTSTRAKTLIERTGKVSAINFDPFSSVRRSASSVLMDYHLTPAVRQGRYTMRELEKAVDNKEIAEDKLPLVTALDAAFTQIVDTTVGNSFMSEGKFRSAINEISRQGYRATLAGLPRMASEALSNMSYILVKGARSWAVGASYGKLLMSPDAFNVLKNVGSVQTNRIYSSSTVSSQLAASEIFNQTAGIRGSQAKGVVANAAQTIYNQTLKRVKNTTEATADLLMSTPDMAMIRPLWFGEFSRAFKKESGKDVDFEKIANNDEKYMADNKAAIDAAKNQADDVTVKAGSSDNNALGILRNTVKPDDNEVTAWYKKFNSYMAKFLLFEYMTARSGINMLMKGNMIEKKEGIALIAAVTTRMMVYQLATRTLTNGFIEMVAGLLGYRDDEEEEEEDDKTVMQRVGQAIASTMSTLLFGRNFGNAARVPLNYGAELLNEEYLQALRKDEYDQYEDALNYTLIPMEKPKGDTGKGVDVMDIFINTLGSATPAVKTLIFLGKKATEDDKKTAEAKQRQSKERMLRAPLEIAGSLGYIPLYKDVRKVTMDAIYGDLDRSEKVTSKSAAGLIEGAGRSFKSSIKEIGEMRRGREISSQEATEMRREAKEDYKERIREVKQKLRESLRK